MDLVKQHKIWDIQSTFQMTDGAVQMFEFTCLPQQSEVCRLICVDFKHPLQIVPKSPCWNSHPWCRKCIFLSLICLAQKQQRWEEHRCPFIWCLWLFFESLSLSGSHLSNWRRNWHRFRSEKSSFAGVHVWFVKQVYLVCWMVAENNQIN